MPNPDQNAPRPTATRDAGDWAREFARAEALELALAREIQAAEDWRWIALSNGELLAEARLKIARLEQVAERRAA